MIYMEFMARIAVNTGTKTKTNPRMSRFIHESGFQYEYVHQLGA